MPLFADPDLLIHLYDGGTISAAELIKRWRMNTAQSIVLKGWKSYDLTAPVPVRLTECQHFECSSPFLLAANARSTLSLHATTRVLSRTRWSPPADQHAPVSGGILASAIEHMKNMLRMGRHDRSKAQSAHVAAAPVLVSKFTLSTVGHLSGCMRAPSGHYSPPIEILDTTAQPIELLDVSNAPKPTCDWAAIGVSGGDLLAISHRQDDPTTAPIWTMDDGDPIRQSALDMYLFIEGTGSNGQYTPLRDLAQRSRGQPGRRSDPAGWWMKGTTERVRLRYPEISEDEFDQISSTAGKLMATAYKLCDRRHAKEPGMGAARRKIRHAQELIEIGDMLRQHPDLSRETIDRVFGAAYLASR